MNISVCKSKKFYDSEWEAQQAAIRAEDRFGDELVPYQCGVHWHLTHKDRAKSRGLGHKFDRCNECGMVMKKVKLKGHRCGYRSRKKRIL